MYSTPRYLVYSLIYCILINIKLKFILFHYCLFFAWQFYIYYLLFYVLWPPSKPKQATAKKIMCKRPCTNCKLNINHMIVSNDIFGWFVCDGQALPLLTRLRRNKKKTERKIKTKVGRLVRVIVIVSGFNIYVPYMSKFLNGMMFKR